MHYKLDERGETSFESILIALLGGVLLIIAVSNILGSSDLIKERALRIELQNIRTAITLFIIQQKRCPESLAELIEKEYALPHSEEGMIKARYLQTASVDSEGRPLDPFGRPYIYDPGRCQIKSATRDYESR